MSFLTGSFEEQKIHEAACLCDQIKILTMLSQNTGSECPVRVRLARIAIFVLSSMPMARPVIVHSERDLETRDRGYRSNERA